MAKSTGLKSSVSLGRKERLPKTKTIDAKKIDRIAKDLSSKKVEKRKEKTTRVTLDIPESLYKTLKIKVATEGKTLREYMLGLANKDLSNEK